MYTCNITGKKFMVEEKDKHREGALFEGYNSRFRAVCYVLTKVLFNRVVILTDCNIDKSIKGIGMSDSIWSTILEKKFNYINTFYHTSPYLDIYNEAHLKLFNGLDFIISSDVFEHIDPYPGVQKAFNNMAGMLKKGGFIVFSVPFGYDNHIEHYPDLYNYNIFKEDGKYMLKNITMDGRHEQFTDLIFHGGPGSTLEMRVFSKNSIIEFLTNAGFVDIIFYKPDIGMFYHGIFWENECSLIISAVKPN